MWAEGVDFVEQGDDGTVILDEFGWVAKWLTLLQRTHILIMQI